MAVGNTSWKQFWDSAYFKALLGLIQENSWPDHVPDFVRTLFVTSLPSDSPNILDFIKMQALRALHHYLYDDSRHGGTSDEAIDDLLYPLLELRNQNKLHIDSPQTMTVLLDFSTRSYAGTLQTISADRRSYDALVDLFCWLSRNGFETFVEVALQADRLDDLVKQRNQPIIHGLLQAVAQFEELFPSLDSNAYANILASMISLTRSSIAMVDDEGYPDSNIIHYERDIVNVLKCVAEQEQRIRFDADIYDACVKICILLAKDAPRYQHGKRPFYYVDKPESDAEVENGARVSLLEAFRYLLERNGYRLTVIKPAGIAHLIPSQYQISVQTVLSSGDVLGPSMQ